MEATLKTIFQFIFMKIFVFKFHSRFPSDLCDNNSTLFQTRSWRHTGVWVIISYMNVLVMCLYFQIYTCDLCSHIKTSKSVNASSTGTNVELLQSGPQQQASMKFEKKESFPLIMHLEMFSDECWHVLGHFSHS